MPPRRPPASNGEVYGRRVAKRYGPCLFACRRCLGLVYASQREIPVSRAMRRAQMIKMGLGGSNDPLEPFTQKPRGMHWRTYRRLCDEAHAAKAEADDLLTEKAEIAVQPHDRRSARSNKSSIVIALFDMAASHCERS
jgi:hypothetical protein